MSGVNLDIKVVTKSYCPFCDMAKSWLKEHSFEYTEEVIMEQTNTTPKTIYEWYLKEHNRLQRYQQSSITSVIEECKDERNEIIACISNELGVV